MISIKSGMTMIVMTIYQNTNLKISGIGFRLDWFPFRGSGSTTRIFTEGLNPDGVIRSILNLFRHPLWNCWVAFVDSGAGLGFGTLIDLGWARWLTQRVRAISM